MSGATQGSGAKLGGPKTVGPKTVGPKIVGPKTVGPKIAVRRSKPASWPTEPDAAVVCCLGDVIVSGEWETVADEGRLATVLGDLAALGADDDLRFGCFETTLEAGAGVIPKEPRGIGRPEVLAECLATLDFDGVSLANNHAFDGYWEGFEAVCQLLADSETASFGAGADSRAAAAPWRVERQGIRFGWLGYTALDTTPSHVASSDGYGVNPLVEEKALAEVARLSRDVDHVIVSLHWGGEYFPIPAPEAITFARRLIDRGARLVVGQHAHVVQGVEVHGDGVIAYNQGSATTTDHAIAGRKAIHQSKDARSSFALRARFDRSALREVELVPFRTEIGRVLVGDRRARKLLEQANRRLEAGISPEEWNRTRMRVAVLGRVLRKLHPSVIGSLRPHHATRVLGGLARVVTGRRRQASEEGRS